MGADRRLAPSGGLARYGASTVRRVSNDAAGLVEAFRARTERQPAGVWAAPGRVNLIGEHTDYNDGYVMPFALAQRVLVAAAPRAGRRSGALRRSTITRPRHSCCRSTARHDRLAGLRRRRRVGPQEAGHGIAGADLVLSSDVPIGAGLSSSAALECAVLTTLADLNDLDIGGLERAKLARRCRERVRWRPDRFDGPSRLHLVHSRPRTVLRLPNHCGRAGSVRHGHRRPGNPGSGHEDPARARRQRIRCPPGQLRRGGTRCSGWRHCGTSPTWTPRCEQLRDR